MIGLRDNLTLSLTKLRVRPVRLIITLVVAGILFTTLVFGSLVVRGVLASLENFTKEGFLNHFIVTAMPSGLPGGLDVSQDKRYIDRAKAIEKDMLDRQVKEAKRLGVEFDPKTAPKATSDSSGDNGNQTALDTTHPAARQAIVELADPHQLENKIKTSAAPYHPQAMYKSTPVGNSFGPSDIELAPIIKGEEQKTSKYGNDYTNSMAMFQSSLTAMDDHLLQPFLLEGTTLATKPGDPIPILAPVDAVEKFLGLAPLSKKATAADKIARLSQLRTQAKDYVFDVCYRNKTATDLRDEAKRQPADIAAHKSEAGYQPPSVIYGTPTSACQPTLIAKDTRTADEKSHDQKLQQFKEEFGTEPATTTRVSFRIVGIMPAPLSPQTASGPDALISGFFTTTLGQGWYTSREATIASPILGKRITDPFALALQLDTNYIEFPSRIDQKQFIDHAGCSINYNGGAPDCGPNGEKLMYLPYGNPLAAIYDLGASAATFFRWVLGVIAALSAIVMMGTIGKVIADSRKETSVFRAVGGKRLDIAQVYLLYTTILSTLAFGVALVLGFGFALTMEAQYSGSLSAAAILAFNSHDLHKTFHLVALQPLDFAAIFAFALATGLISASLPLLGNLRRNPAKDMREE